MNKTMSTAKFRNQIAEFRNSLPSSIMFTATGIKFIPNNVSVEDRLILDFIKNVHFSTLYKSKEFREMLDKRMEIKRLHKLITI